MAASAWASSSRELSRRQIFPGWHELGGFLWPDREQAQGFMGFFFLALVLGLGSSQSQGVLSLTFYPTQDLVGF